MRAAELAPAVAADELPPYSCPKSPRRVTRPQLPACRVPRAYQKQAYRGVADPLAASDDRRRVLGPARVPDYSTLQLLADRAVTPDLIARLLGRLVGRVGPAVEGVAMDSTGVEPSNARAYYTARRGTRRKGSVKLPLVVICGCLRPLPLVVSRGPRHDASEAADLLGRAGGTAEPKRRFAGKGSDAERVREFRYRVWGVRSHIPAVVKRKGGAIGGHFRSRMRTVPKAYGKRWHAEPFMSGRKRTTGSALTARKDNTLDAEASLRVLAYSVRR